MFMKTLPYAGLYTMKKLFVILICLIVLGLISVGCCGGGGYDEWNADSEDCDDSG